MKTTFVGCAAWQRFGEVLCQSVPGQYYAIIDISDINSSPIFCFPFNL